jgi:hypothetical protein
MKMILQEASLNSDLDAAEHDLLNVAALDPVPGNLCASDDPRLTDARVPLTGSVTDASVALFAGIEQSKLDLNGVIPSAWLGTANTQAAQGDLAEYAANKNQPNGYAGLDGGGKILPAQLPGSVGTGTVTSVSLIMPGEFLVAGSPVITAGVLSVNWASIADNSWFGNKEGSPGAPQFYTDPLPAVLIPDLDTAKVISGVFDPVLLPDAVGLGGGHAPGAVPDPGDGSGGALGSDYLARDMSWKPFPSIGPTYQPTIDNPTINASTNPTGDKTLTFSDVIDGVTYFYSLVGATSDFQELPEAGYIFLAPSATVWVYAARSGYNNSAVVDYTNPNP